MGQRLQRLEGNRLGCFDLAIDAAGEYTWIELNPNGQWGWLETKAEVPITAAFADLLEQGIA